jgi:ABC-2 type transport system permease protein
MARKEAIQLRRDPGSLLLAFAMPLVLVVLFGYAISWDVRDIPLAVLDRDQSRESRALVDAFLASGYFELAERVERESDAQALLEKGAVRIAILIPPGFQRDLTSEIGARVQALLDGDDANTATIALAYAEGIVREFDLRRRPLDVRPPIDVRIRIWYNEELVSRNMIVPGLVAVIMMIVGGVLTSLTLAREWERGTMEQLASSPVSRAEVVLGKMLPYFAIGMIDVMMVAGVGVLLFGVPFRGSILLLAALSAAFISGALGIGVVISAATRSQVLATQIALIVTFLPTFLLSGFMFAIDVMPVPLQAITYLIPARYFLVITRGIFLKGVGLEAMALEAFLMVAFAVLGVFAAARIFRKEIA